MESLYFLIYNAGWFVFFLICLLLSSIILTFIIDLIEVCNAMETGSIKTQVETEEEAGGLIHDDPENELVR